MQDGDALDAVRAAHLPPNQRVSESLNASMNIPLPKAPVPLILRKREAGKYRVVNALLRA